MVFHREIAMPRRILIGHPDPEPKRLCRALAASYANGARSAGTRFGSSAGPEVGEGFVR